MIPSLNEIYAIFGIVVSIVLTVYWRIRRLEKLNANLKKENLKHDLSNIEKDNASRSDSDLVDRANGYWKGRQ